MRARASSFEWLSERVSNYFSDPANANALVPAQVIASAAIAEELFAYCTPEKLENEDSGLGGLLRSLREAKERLGGGASPAGEKGSAGTASAPAVSSSSNSGGGMEIAINVPPASWRAAWPSPHRR